MLLMWNKERISCKFALFSEPTHKIIGWICSTNTHTHTLIERGWFQSLFFIFLMKNVSARLVFHSSLTNIK